VNAGSYAHEGSQFKQLTWGVFSCLGVRHLNKGQNASYIDLMKRKCVPFSPKRFIIKEDGWQPYWLQGFPCLSMILSTAVTSLLPLSSLCQSCYSVFHHLALFLPYEYLIAHVSYRHSKSQVFKDILQILPGAISLKLVQWILDTGQCLRDEAQSWIMRRPNQSLNVCCKTDLRSPLTTYTTQGRIKNSEGPGHNVLVRPPTLRLAKCSLFKDILIWH